MQNLTRRLLARLPRGLFQLLDPRARILDGRIMPLLALIAAFLVILGARLWLIRTFGSATPFWDQWDGEAAELYKPYLEGNLRLTSLFSLHNEHRIFFTRILALALLKVNGSWDPILQMVVNAGLYSISAAALLLLLWPPLEQPKRLFLAIFVSGIFAVPFGWENALAGFQSQFFLLLLFTYGAIFCFHGQAAFSARWWLGVGLSVSSFFCMASGALTPLAVVAVCTAQIAIGIRRGWTEIAGVALLSAIALVLVFYVPTLAHHAELRAASLAGFLSCAAHRRQLAIAVDHRRRHRVECPNFRLELSHASATAAD